MTDASPRLAEGLAMMAEEIMTGDVVTVEETTTIGAAYRVLRDLAVRHLPVVRDREVVGMLSDRDFRSLGLDLTGDLEGADRIEARLSPAVSTLMSGDVLTVDRTADLTEVIDLMVEEKVGAVPVVDEDTNDLVGLVSYIDVLRALRESLA